MSAETISAQNRALPTTSAGHSTWAVVAAVLGVLSIFLFPAPLTLIVSLVAMVDLRHHRKLGRPKRGLWLAVFGVTMGALGTLLFPIALWFLNPA